MGEVMIYLSSVAGNTLVNKAQRRAQDILTGRKIAFSTVDVAADEDAKNYMLTTSQSNALPQIFVDGQFKAFIEQLEDANEVGEVPQLLGLAEKAAA